MLDQITNLLNNRSSSISFRISFGLRATERATIIRLFINIANAIVKKMVKQADIFDLT